MSVAASGSLFEHDVQDDTVVSYLTHVNGNIMIIDH